LSSGKGGRCSRKATPKVAKAHQRSPNKISRVCNTIKTLLFFIFYFLEMVGVGKGKEDRRKERSECNDRNTKEIE
jgi:hypothetical protein